MYTRIYTYIYIYIHIKVSWPAFSLSHALTRLVRAVTFVPNICIYKNMHIYRYMYVHRHVRVCVCMVALPRVYVCGHTCTPTFPLSLALVRARCVLIFSLPTTLSFPPLPSYFQRCGSCMHTSGIHSAPFQNDCCE